MSGVRASPTPPAVRRRRVLAALLAAGVLAGAGCASDEAAAGRDASTTTSTTTAAVAGCDGDAGEVARSTPEEIDLSVGGTDRWYQRVVPAGYDGSPVALVVDLHGYLSGAAGQAAMSDLASTAEREGFVLATPQGNGALPYWNAVPHDDLPDDVAFVDAVIDDVAADVCIDPDRVYVDGFSNGAFLTSLVACELADRVAAVAAVAGLMVPEGCAPARPVPVLAIHGTADRFVGADGPPNPALDDLQWDDESRAAFDGLPFAPVTASAETWAELDGCAPDPTRTAVSPAVERVAYGGCEGDAAVELYLVDGGGHTWPGSAFSHASESILGPTTDDIVANDLIWSFFEEHPMP